MTALEKTVRWLDERMPMSAWLQAAGKKTVPVHRHAVWYYMGGVVLILLLVQVVTGAMLMVYYIPEIGSANASILRINTNVDFGWFIRSLHSWGANIMILAAFIHMFSTYFMKAYRPPREITWLTGLGLLLVAFAFGFTGYLLPWDEMSYFATRIGLDITAQAPLAGEFIANLLRGGSEISQATLSRFFVIHVILLPIMVAVLLGVHLFLIQLQGMSEPEEYRQRSEAGQESEKFFPTFILKDMMVWLVVLNILAILTTLYPWSVGPAADPFAPAPAGIKPEWYFLAMFQVLKIIPAHVGPFEGEQVGMALFGLVGLGFVLAPFIDRGRDRRVSALAAWYGLAVLVGLVVFTIWGMAA